MPGGETGHEGQEELLGCFHLFLKGDDFFKEIVVGLEKATNGKTKIEDARQEGPGS